MHYSLLSLLDKCYTVACAEYLVATLRGPYQHYVTPICHSGWRTQERQRSAVVDAPYASYAGAVAATPAVVAVPATAAVVALVEDVLVGECAPAAASAGVLGVAVVVVVTAVAVADVVAGGTDRGRVALPVVRSPLRLGRTDHGS